jgi:hypothetical protein
MTDEDTGRKEMEVEVEMVIGMETETEIVHLAGCTLHVNSKRPEAFRL